MEYKKPVITKGKDIEVYACNGNTCNGANRAWEIERAQKEEPQKKTA
ncbi:hypothetical protein [Gorillibacterium sp. CAU 1737]